MNCLTEESKVRPEQIDRTVDGSGDVGDATLCLFFLPNFPGATFIQGATFIPDSRVCNFENAL